MESNAMHLLEIIFNFEILFWKIKKITYYIIKITMTEVKNQSASLQQQAENLK